MLVIPFFEIISFGCLSKIMKSTKACGQIHEIWHKENYGRSQNLL